MTQTKPSPSPVEPLRICLLHDDRIGHQQQLRGLEQALGSLTDIQADWIPVNGLHLDHSFSGHVNYDLIIGAGHKTHLPLLRLSRQQHAFSCVLMTPTLPNFLFNAVIAPRHDSPRKSARVFESLGPLTAIKDKALPSTENDYCLALIGGPSKHFGWDTEQVIRQLVTAREKDPHTRFYVLCSRRTPTEFVDQARAALGDESVLGSDEVLEPWLLSASKLLVTPDSSNMLFESLSTTSTVQVLRLNPIKRFGRRNRLQNELNRLEQEGRITLFNDVPDRQTSVANEVEPLCEADRAATWLIQRYRHWRRDHD